MGHTGNVNHPEVRAVMDQAIADIVKAGRHAGTLVNDDTIEAAIAKGVSMVSVSWTNWLSAGARAFLEKVEQASR
jgi:2-keto-3-deoxy-L-rhamnonate aldolase RhmA